MSEERWVEMIAETLAERDPHLEAALVDLGLPEEQIEVVRRASINDTLAKLVDRGMNPELADRARSRIEELL